MRINDEIREAIQKDYETGKYSYASLGAKYGISSTSIGRIVNPDYQEREREKNKIRQRSYNQPKPAYTANIRFYDKDQALIQKVKSVENIQQYIKDLIEADIKNS